MFQFMRKSDRDRDRDKGGKAGVAGSGSSGGTGGGSGGGGGGAKVEKMEKVGFGKKVKDKLSPEDLHRLDEIRRSFKLGKGKKEKQKLPSGIIADYSENFMQPPTVGNQSGTSSNQSTLQRSPGSRDQDGGSMPSITHSDSSESSLSITSNSKEESLSGSSSANVLVSPRSAGGPAKPPRASPKSPPPVPPRQQSTSSSRYSGDYGMMVGDLSSPSRPSRPPTSASSSSFTPSYVTPPQSPSHNALSLAKFYPEPELELSEQVLPNIAPSPGCCRTIVIERQPTGDFGFSIRRASVAVKGGGQDSILFVEPTQGSTQARDFSQDFLLPGDRLVAVNSVSVESKTRDDVINLIKSSQQTITLKVISNVHWIENIVDIRYEQDNDSSMRRATANSSDSVWILHKNGFVNGRVMKKVDESGKCSVRLDTGQNFDICEDDIENMNPDSMDLTAYLWSLNLINESSILHTLRNRFHNTLPITIVTNTVMTYLTRNIIVDLENQRQVRLIPQPFTSSKLLPNLYSVANQCYRAMIINKRNQSVVFQGQSDGLTKRECIKEILKYLAETRTFKSDKSTASSGSTSNSTSSASSTNSTSNTLSVPTLSTSAPTIPTITTTSSPGNIAVPSFSERLTAMQSLVEFFCSAYESQQEKSTVMYNVEFDLGGRMIGINTQIFCLDIERLYDGIYFTVIQALHDLSTCPLDTLGPYLPLKQLRKELFLSETDREGGNQSVPFFTSEISSSTDPVANLNKLTSILSAMVSLGLGETFTKSVWSVFGAVYHLGHVVGTVANAVLNGNKSSSKQIEWGQQHFKSACSLLGLSLDNVEKTLVMDEHDTSRVRNVLGFSLGLYAEAVNSLFTTVNKSNSVGFRNIQCLSISLVQIGGSATENGARFGDLSTNYLNDRISKIIKEVSYDRLNKLYRSEGIDLLSQSDSSNPGTPVPFEGGSFSNGGFNKVGGEDDILFGQYDSLPLLDSFPSAATTNGGGGGQQTKGKGLLYFLDDAKEPARCLEKFESEFYGESQFRSLYSADFRNTSLTLAHANATRIVEYDIKRVLHHVDIAAASKFTNLLVQESQKDNINCMFLKSTNSVIGICLASTASDIGLRRASSIRRNYTTTWQKKSASLNIKVQADYLMEILGRTQMQVVYCLNPSTNSKRTGDLDVNLLRRQIRSMNIPNTIRYYKSGYPHAIVQSEFVRKFKCLGSPGLSEEGVNIRDRVTDIFDKQDLPSSAFKLGTTMVFMKPWLLDELEKKQKEKLEGLFISLQSNCRGFLARRRLEKMKVRDVAIRCVQKNVRKLLAVRDWPWWKMYQQISPLIKVQSSHEKLQSAQDELASLKLKFEKSEAEKNRLRSENEKLEIRVNELSAELADEQATSAITSEKLEQEMSDKQKLESQLASFKARCQNLETEKQQLELDLAYSISEVNGDSTPDEFNEDSVYKQRWERCKRELEMFKQRLKQREQDHLDQIMILKKSLEKKCSDAWEESEEQRQIVAQLKRRIQKLSSELSDVRCLHQEESSRCALLEKKQRRFDAELSNLNVQFEKEKISKERAIRERDAAVIQIDSIQNEIQGVRMELQMKESKLASMEAELEETSQMGGSSEQLNALRKAKNDLQMKTKEQEEELDDLAGQVQSLESTKLRLEMQIEQNRKEHKREVQQREEEIEDVRGSAQKKVKALECQLEAEHEERTAILRAKQEIERKLFEMEEYTASQTASQEQISRLKRELKRTRALLKDAQTMVEQSKNDVLGKGMLRQLRHQLEDSESQRTRLSRAKQKVEEELADCLAQLEDLSKSRNEAENIKNQLLREKSSYQMQLEETEEQLAEVMKKYKAAVEQLSVDQNTIMEQSIQISELESATSNLRETIAELTAKLETLEGDQASQQIQKRFQMKIREVETRLELESTTKSRLEGQVSRYREHIEKYQEDIKNSQTRENLALDKCRKFERQIRDFKEEILRLSQRESDVQSRKSTLEKQLESAELEISTLKNDLKLAMQRIDDLTAVIKECDDVSDYDEDEDSSTESVTSTTELTATDLNLPYEIDKGASSSTYHHHRASDSESFA